MTVSSRPVRAALTAVGASVLGLVAWGQFSPRPVTALVRLLFDSNSNRTAQRLLPHEPPVVVAQFDVPYLPDDPDARLDVFRAPESVGPLPTVVWIHGGGWVSGDKSHVASYLKILASYGFTAVGINYSKPPRACYPRPLRQINEALSFLQANADRFGIDAGKLTLAGDSAGAQLASQTAAIITNPALAADMGITPALSPRYLRSVVLACGTYDLHVAPKAVTAIDWAADQVAWSYWGHRDHRTDPRTAQMRTAEQATRDYPRTFLTVGNKDPLQGQSRALAARLSGLGVDVSTLFYDAGHQPGLPHEYQFDLDGEDGKRCLAAIVEFLRE